MYQLNRCKGGSCNRVTLHSLLTFKKEEGSLGQPKEQEYFSPLFQRGLLQADEPSLPDNFVLDVDWQPDSRAVNDPAHYRVNAWQNTSLGMRKMITALLMYTYSVE